MVGRGRRREREEGGGGEGRRGGREGGFSQLRREKLMSIKLVGQSPTSHYSIMLKCRQTERATVAYIFPSIYLYIARLTYKRRVRLTDCVRQTYTQRLTVRTNGMTDSQRDI